MPEKRDERGLPAGRPPRPAGRRRILLAVVVLLIAVGAACAPRLLSDPARMSWLVAGALPELEGDVTFRAVHVGWAGPVVLEGIRVVPRDGTTSPLAIARIEAGNGLAAILGSCGDLGRVSVDGLEADIVFDERQRSNLSGLFRPAPDAAAPSGRAPHRSPVRMRLEVRDAVVRIAGPWNPEPWASDAIDVRATLAPAADGPWSEWTVEPVEILAEARLDPNVAQGVLAYIAPVLARTTRTGGRFSLRLDGARLPVGRPAEGTLAGMLTMHEVVVGPGPMVENLLAALPIRLPVPPAIRIADGSRVAFRMADRLVAHEGLEFGLPLAGAGQRLDVQSDGTVAIDDGALDLTLRLPIPAAISENRPVLAPLAGKSLSVGIRGTLGHPRVEFDGSVRDAATELLADLLDQLRAGPASGNGTDADPAANLGTADAVIDIVGGIVEEIARRRAERQALETVNPDAPPSRQPRARRRGGPGPAADR